MALAEICTSLFSCKIYFNKLLLNCLKNKIMKEKFKFIWFNGKIISSEKAKISVVNHGLHYGSSVFEGIRCYNTKNGPAVFRLKDHIDRLFFSSKAMGMKILFSKQDLIFAIKELIKKNNFKECYIRPIFFYGEKMGLLPVKADVYACIIAWPWGKYLSKESVSVKTSSIMRIHPNSSIMEAKISGHYSNSIIASLEALKSGYDEALLLDYKKNIAEGPAENIFFVRGKIIETPKRRAILPGITRDSVIKIAKNFGYIVKEKDIKIKDLKNYDEAFFTGTAVEICNISKIDDLFFEFKKEESVVKKFKMEYEKIIHGENKKYLKWLDYLYEK